MLCEPANAQLVGSGKAQERTADGSPAGSHPAFEPHPIQGWTPDFIPLVLQEALDKKYYDERVPIAGAEGVKWAQALAQKEGIFTGISGGSTFAVALQVAEKAPAGSVILCDAARHRRALPHDAAVRRHRRGHGRGGDAHLQVDAGLSDAGVTGRDDRQGTRIQCIDLQMTPDKRQPCVVMALPLTEINSE